jgi:hypothetical protein
LDIGINSDDERNKRAENDYMSILLEKDGLLPRRFGETEATFRKESSALGKIGDSQSMKPPQ